MSWSFWVSGARETYVSHWFFKNRPFHLALCLLQLFPMSCGRGQCSKHLFLRGLAVDIDVFDVNAHGLGTTLKAYIMLVLADRLANPGCV